MAGSQVAILLFAFSMWAVGMTIITEVTENEYLLMGYGLFPLFLILGMSLWG